MKLKDMVVSLPTEWVEMQENCVHMQRVEELSGTNYQTGLYYVRKMKLTKQLKRHQVEYIGQMVAEGHQTIVYKDNGEWKVDRYTNKRRQDHHRNCYIIAGCKKQNPVHKYSRPYMHNTGKKPMIAESRKQIFEECKGRRTFKKPNLTGGSVLPNGRLTRMNLSQVDYTMNYQVFGPRQY